MKLSLVSNRYPNNTNANNTNLTTATKREKVAVVAVNFKKLKEEGEEKMRVIRERIVKLNFKEEFIEKMLKEYSVKKIEEKLDLLMERKNIQSPAGWLRSALKDDYRDEEPAEQESQPIKLDSRFRLPVQARQTGGNDIKVGGNDKCRGTMHRPFNPQDNKKILSTEEARERFHLLRQKLMAMK